MSFLTIASSARDQELRSRIQACVLKQAWTNATYAVTEFGKLVRFTPEKSSDMVFAVCSSPDVETAYAFALENEITNPGGNEAIVTDAMILAVIQLRWPMGAI